MCQIDPLFTFESRSRHRIFIKSIAKSNLSNSKTKFNLYEQYFYNFKLSFNNLYFFSQHPVYVFKRYFQKKKKKMFLSLQLQSSTSITTQTSKNSSASKGDTFNFNNNRVHCAQNPRNNINRNRRVEVQSNRDFFRVEKSLVPFALNGFLNKGIGNRGGILNNGVTLKRRGGI